MTVHHLNCGTINPVGGSAAVCHVLLVETDRGLTLVDTGIGVRDIADPAGRLGRGSVRVLRPALNVTETALAQIEARGFAASDVTDIVMTHLDFDHAGGVDDFPAARMHVSAAELANADAEPGPSPAVRYRGWRTGAHPERVQTYAQAPDDWFGFAAVPAEGLGGDVVLVALPGHTEGHMGVAVRDGDGWILHCGDAFYHRNAILGGRVPGALRFAQFVSARRPRHARQTRDRLADLHGRSAGRVTMVCAHDPVQLEDAAAPTDR